MNAEASRNIFSVIMDLGASMLTVGAEVYRVEDSLFRLLKAYGGQRLNVFAIPSHIVVTAEICGEEQTLTRRVHSPKTNLETLHALNDLSRKLCRETPDAETANALLRQALNTRVYKPPTRAFIYAAVSATFALFFGGNGLDALASAFGGLFIFLLARLAHSVKANALFTGLFCAAGSAFSAILWVNFGFACHTDSIIIGNIMLLIPGVELVNGMRDFIAGDIQAGLLHLAEAIVLAVGIAVGAAGVFTLMGGVA